MSDYKNDARYLELQFLARFEHERWVQVQYTKNGGTFESDKQRQMVLSLVLREMLNGPDVRTESYADEYAPAGSHRLAAAMDAHTRRDKADTINSLLCGHEVRLEMGHLGRLRLYELQDHLKATRLRDPFGILFDGRYVERDLAIAIMNSRPEAPASLAYLDMNGLKAFNEDGDHATGDAAIKAFFHAVEKAVSGAGDAYRKGGDEVVVIMPGTPLKVAQKYLHAALVSLAEETVNVKGEHRQLSSSCGLVSVNTPKANAEGEIHRADVVQKKAKEASKRPDNGRCSALFVQDETGEIEETLIL